MTAHPGSDKLRQQIAQLTSQYRVFQCVDCAQAIKAFLQSKGIHGKQIKLDLGVTDLPWAVIYDLKRQQQISTNGCHEGIALRLDDQDIVFDNIDHQGIPRREWLENLTSPTLELGRGNFRVEETEF